MQQKPKNRIGKIPGSRWRFYLLSLLLLLTAPSCHPAKSSYDPVLQNTGGENGGNPAAEQEMGGETPPFGENEETTSQETDEDPLTELLLWKPNELGDIIILMYHEIGSPEGEWRRTPENFRRDLQTLYGLGYRAVSLQDVVNGRIDIPAGTSPVVLTFDDGNKGNFNYLKLMVSFGWPGVRRGDYGGFYWKTRISALQQPFISTGPILSDSPNICRQSSITWWNRALK